MKCSGPVAGALIVAFKPQNNYRDVTQQGLAVSYKYVDFAKN